MKMIEKKTGSPFIYWVAISFLLVFASACSDEESIPVNDDPKAEVVDYVAKTEDKLTVMSDLPAYVIPYDYKGFGAALVNRLTNKVAKNEEGDVSEELSTVVLHSSHLQDLGEDFGLLVVQLITGKNIVILEPTIEDFRFFCFQVTIFYLLITDGGSDLEVLQGMDMIPGMRQTLEAFMEMSEDESKIASLFLTQTDSEGVFAEALAVRGSHFHIVDRMKGVVDTQTTYEKRDTTTNTIVSVDKPEFDVPAGGMSEETVTPYTYGLFADMFTQWINEQESYIEEMEEARSRGLNTFNSRSETQKLNLEDITTVQKVEYTMYAARPLDWLGIGNSQPVSVKFEICSVYQGGSDYYCIYKRIKSYNQYLNCGPSEERKWYENSNFFYLRKNGRDDYAKWLYGIYGPFMRDIKTKGMVHAETDIFANSEDGFVDISDNVQIDRIQNAKIEDYSPKNSIGSTDVSHSFSKGFDGGLYLAKEPSLSLSLSFSWDTSTSRTVSDLAVEASSLDGIAKWDYIGQNLPEAYYHLTKSPSKRVAPEIMRQECEVDQSWIWEIPNPSGTYRLYDETTITNSLLYYQYGFFKCVDNYANQETTKRISFHLPAPPRYQQRWTMHVEPDTHDAVIRNLHGNFWDADGKEVKLPDASEDSRTAIHDFIGSFKREIEKKRLSWIQKKLFGTYTFKYINLDDSDVVEFTINVEEPVSSE